MSSKQDAQSLEIKPIIQMGQAQFFLLTTISNNLIHFMKDYPLAEECLKKLAFYFEI